MPLGRNSRADLNAVLAVTGSTQLGKGADVRLAGRQVRAKAHLALHRDRGERCTVEREATEGAYSRLPVWSHRDQWLYLVQAAITAWFPEHRGQVGVATLLKFAVLVAAEADDDTGRRCRRVYSLLAVDMAVTVETVRKCWRALERLGLAVQVERSVCFSYNERMRIWRLERSKQRGHTPEYALVVPSAYARALTTGEHPADLLAQESAGAADNASEYGGPDDEPVTPLPPIQKLSAALSKLQSTPALTATQKPSEVATARSNTLPAADQSQVDKAPVDNSRPHPFKKLENVDILGLPRSGPRCTFGAALSLVAVVPHGVKSTASRAHNRGDGTDSAGSGGSAARKGAQKRCTGQGSWYGPHRDIAFILTRRVVWMKRSKPGEFAPQFKRFTVPGLPKIWTPDDFINAMDQINQRQGRYSPGANLDSRGKTDQAHAQHASAGTVRTPMSMLKWYLDQLDPVNDHPRFVLDAANEQLVSGSKAFFEARYAEPRTPVKKAQSRDGYLAARRAAEQRAAELRIAQLKAEAERLEQVRREQEARTADLAWLGQALQDPR